VQVKISTCSPSQGTTSHFICGFCEWDSDMRAVSREAIWMRRCLECYGVCEHRISFGGGERFPGGEGNRQFHCWKSNR
jgi:hypothetical protein